jgi:hypothetical protein
MLRGHASPFQPSSATRPGASAARPAEPVPIYLPLERAIERLEEVVDQETAALRSRAGVDLADFNNRKSQGLLDLNRALRSHDGLARDKAALARLAGLRAKLDANRAVLKTHLDADARWQPCSPTRSATRNRTAPTRRVSAAAAGGNR